MYICSTRFCAQSVCKRYHFHLFFHSKLIHIFKSSPNTIISFHMTITTLSLSFSRQPTNHTIQTSHTTSIMCIRFDCALYFFISFAIYRYRLLLKPSPHSHTQSAILPAYCYPILTIWLLAPPVYCVCISISRLVWASVFAGCAKVCVCVFSLVYCSMSLRFVKEYVCVGWGAVAQSECFLVNCVSPSIWRAVRHSNAVFSFTRA